MIGWVSLLRAKATESVIASTKVLLLELSGEQLIASYKQRRKFAEWFNSKTVKHELIEVSTKFTKSQPTLEPTWKEEIERRIAGGQVITYDKNENIIKNLPELARGFRWHLSAPELKNKGIGSIVDSLEELECENYSLPVRLVSSNLTER